MDAPGDLPGHAGVWLRLPPADSRGKIDPLQPVTGHDPGEAEFIGRLARKYHWHSVAVVTITPQDTLARLRIGRCFAGPVYVVTTPNGQPSLRQLLGGEDVSD